MRNASGFLLVVDLAGGANGLRNFLQIIFNQFAKGRMYDESNVFYFFGSYPRPVFN